MKTAVVFSIPISRPSEVCYFQFILPGDVERIISISPSICNLTGHGRFNVRRAGTITLQTTGQTNFFYAADVLLDSPWLFKEDLGFTAVIAGFESPYLFGDKLAQSGKFFPEKINVPNQRYLYGVYKGLADVVQNLDIRYSVVLTIEVENGFKNDG